MTRPELYLALVSLAACVLVAGLEWRAARRRRRENAEWMKRFYEADEANEPGE